MGLGEKLAHNRGPDWLVLVPLVLYVAGFLLFPPRAITVSDENSYVSQAIVFASGHRLATTREPLTGAERQEPAAWYPVGTSALQAPLVYFGGWRAAAWLSVIALVVTILLLARWLEEAGRPAAFSLLLLAYAPTLVLGRTAMSDLPSAAVVTLGLWLFWRGQEAGWLTWLLAGLVAGASLLFRDTNALLFAPLFAGATLRRDRAWPALLVGGLAGVAVRLASSAWMFGNALYVRVTYGFSLPAFSQNVALYAFALLVLLPGGLVGVLAYCGRRRPEVLATVVLTLVFFLFYDYSALESGILKRLVLGARYFIPLGSLVVFACAESFPRMLRLPWEWLKREGWLPFVRWSATALVAGVAFAVHPVMARWAGSQASIADAIYSSTAPSSVLVTHPAGTYKFISLAYGTRSIASRYELPPSAVPRIRAANADTYLVLLDRTDSAFFRAEITDNARYREQVEKACRLTLVHDCWHDAEDRLRIWRVDACNPAAR